MSESNAGRRLSHAELAKLSKLSTAQLDAFIRRWPELPSAERRRATRAMVQLAEENVDFDYNDLFLRLIGDVDPEVRATAIEGLWEDARPLTADVLIAIARSDPDPRSRAAAFDGIGRFALRLSLGEVSEPLGRRIRELLREYVAPTAPNELRGYAVRAAGYLDEPEFREAIQSAYASSSTELRVSAIAAMGRSCDPLWIDTIVRELESDDPVVRHEAARAAAEQEDERAVPALIALLSDDDSEVRLAAIEALGAVGGPRARQALYNTRASRDEVMRSAAEEALDELEIEADPFGVQVRDVHPN